MLESVNRVHPRDIFYFRRIWRLSRLEKLIIDSTVECALGQTVRGDALEYYTFENGSSSSDSTVSSTFVPLRRLSNQHMHCCCCPNAIHTQREKSHTHTKRELSAPKVLFSGIFQAQDLNISPERIKIWKLKIVGSLSICILKLLKLCSRNCMETLM